MTLILASKDSNTRFDFKAEDVVSMEYQALDMPVIIHFRNGTSQTVLFTEGEEQLDSLIRVLDSPHT